MLHLLGSLALEQKRSIEAESWYRESLVINEHLGNRVVAAMTCNQLASVSSNAGRPLEAEGWWKRALELVERANSGGPDQAKYFNNLANLLINEVQGGRANRTRLTEARNYAEQALVIKEKLDASLGIWHNLKTLAVIADLEGRTEEVRGYRRRERETYADFEGNRYHIDRQHGQLIADIAAAAKGDTQARTAVEEALPQLEENGWKIASATQRIWAGEREWDSLVEDLDRQVALLILRVLETIAQPEEAQNITPEQVFALLPVTIREAMERGDQAAVEKAFEALSQEEQQAVMKAIQFLQGQENDDESIAEDGE